MTLSITKLEQLLGTKGISIKNIFTIDNYAVYIQVFNNKDADSFMIYIPSKYNIKIEEGEDNNVFKIKFLELDSEEELIKNDDIDIDNDYNEIDVNTSPEKGNLEDLELALKNNYNKQVSLQNLIKEDKKNVKDIYYQLNRFKLCVQNIKYKLSIIYKNYLCSIKRDNTIECFLIRNYPVIKERKIFVTIDLENLYSKLSNVTNDIKVVKNSIYSVLNKNQLKHTKILNDLLDEKKNIIVYSEIINEKKKNNDYYLLELESLLVKLNNTENDITNKIMNIKNKYESTGIKGLHNDIGHVHELSKYETKLENIIEIKEEIIIDIIELRSKQENITLLIDKIFFDNSIMINTVTMNLNNLSKLI